MSDGVRLTDGEGREGAELLGPSPLVSLSPDLPWTAPRNETLFLNGTHAGPQPHGSPRFLLCVIIRFPGLQDPLDQAAFLEQLEAGGTPVRAHGAAHRAAHAPPPTPRRGSRHLRTKPPSCGGDTVRPCSPQHTAGQPLPQAPPGCPGPLLPPGFVPSSLWPEARTGPARLFWDPPAPPSVPHPSRGPPALPSLCGPHTAVACPQLSARGCCPAPPARSSHTLYGDCHQRPRPSQAPAPPGPASRPEGRSCPCTAPGLSREASEAAPWPGPGICSLSSSADTC